MAWQDNPVQYSEVGGVVTANWGTGGKFAPGTYQYLKAPGLAGADPNGMAWFPVSSPGAGLSGPGVSTSTGVNPTETAYALYGHIIPLSVFGVGRIGGEIIAGPWIENGRASFCISFGVPADPAGARDLREIAFDSEVVWTAAGGFSTEAFTFRFYPGTLTQAADPLEITHYGTDAVAYRPQMLLWFENLPLAGTKFNKIPYVAAVIGDASGDDVNLGEAFERLAYSPWVGYTSGQFETVGITDGLVYGGLIIAQDSEFLATIQQFGRFYRNWDILQTDKLRIVDRGATVTADLILDKTRLMNQIAFTRVEPNSVPRELELSTIDPGADYSIVPSKASRPREPVNVSASVSLDSAYLPMIMDSATRISLVTYTKYQEEIARKKISGTAMMFGLQIEPGDLLGLTGLGADFQNEVFKVVETLHGANYSIEFAAEAFLNCEIPATDPGFVAVVLLLGFEGADGSTGAPGFTDESSSAHGTGTPSGIAYPETIDTSQSRFGMSSLLLPPYSTLPVGLGLITFPHHVDWKLADSNSDQYTVECWIRFNDFFTDTAVIVGQNAGGAGQAAWSFEVDGTTREFAFRSSATGGTAFNANVVSSGAALTTNVWYHLAADKDSSGKIRIYKDGVMMGSATPANSSIFASVSELAIGCRPGHNGVNGWIDELRISKGICRYGSDGGYVVPTSAFPRE
ncbi:MAG: LamG domain-containing protein [Tardiphaga sp.]